MPRLEDSILRGSPGIREKSGGRLPDEAEEVRVVFGSVARGLECLGEGLG